MTFHASTRRSFLKRIVSGVSVCLMAAKLFGAAADDFPGLGHASVRAVMVVQQELTPGLMAIEGVLGTAVGLGGNNEVVLVVYLDEQNPAIDEIKRALPAQLRGVPVRPEVTEKFRSFARPGSGGGGGGGVSHQARQTPPIQLGTSGGWRLDLANGYCCAGTLGALVQVNGDKYILSNYHVFEMDTVPGGNGILAQTGDGVIHPGLIDVSCNANSSAIVGNLMKLGALPGANVDCSIARVALDANSSPMVRDDGAILEIGPLSSTTLGAALNLPVKKSGRTTALTRSRISGLNATINITYENECAGGTAFTKTFTGQIVIANSRRNVFLAGGDSGSLLVEDVVSNPRSVGLLYAGSTTTAIANPIGEVLGFIGSRLGGTAVMVGN